MTASRRDAPTSVDRVMEGVGGVSADTLSVKIQLVAQLCLVCSL